MTKDNNVDQVLSRVGSSRRGFVRKAILGTAFTAPIVASFSMDGLAVGAARAGSVSNSTF